MNLYGYEAAFGAADVTSRAMKKAIAQWHDLYYRQTADEHSDPSQRIAYTVVGKLVRAVFGEYRLEAATPFGQAVAKELESIRRKAMEMALIGGECYVKPCPSQTGFSFALMDRANVLIFGRDASGAPTDMGFAEQSVRGQWYYTLLERRTLDAQGLLTVENKLYRSKSKDALGQQVALTEHPDYAALPETFTFPEPVGMGLVRLKTPMLNCVDGSGDGVSVYAAAAGLIQAIDQNEAQLSGEFSRGQSRVFVSSDLLRDGQLQDSLFVGLDEDPEHVGVQIFAPALREQSYLARKQEYLRNIESVIGLKRGMLSDANEEERTATEISASSGEFNLTVIDFQQVWQKAVAEAMSLCKALGGLFGVPVEDVSFSIDWGNGTLYDEDKLWSAYVEMVDKGMLKPEVALGWRFDLPASTQEEQAAIRQKLMPGTTDTKEKEAGR